MIAMLGLTTAVGAGMATRHVDTTEAGSTRIIMRDGMVTTAIIVDPVALPIIVARAGRIVDRCDMVDRGNTEPRENTACTADIVPLTGTPIGAARRVHKASAGSVRAATGTGVLASPARAPVVLDQDRFGWLTESGRVAHRWLGAPWPGGGERLAVVGLDHKQERHRTTWNRNSIGSCANWNS